MPVGEVQSPSTPRSSTPPAWRKGRERPVRFKSLSVLVLAGSVLASLIAAPTASAHRRTQPSTQVTTHLTRAPHLRSDGRVGPAAARAMRQGYLPFDQAAY